MRLRVLIIGLGLVAVAGGLALWFALRQPGRTSQTNTNSRTNTGTIESTPDAAAAQETTDRREALAVARLVVERSGSYAAATALQAADEIRTYATDAGLRTARERAQAEQARLAGLGSDATLTTDTQTSTLTLFRSGDSAEVRLDARQAERVTGREFVSRSVVVTVALVVRDGRWLADRLTWSQ